jgi:hypothetical protein
MKKAGAKMAQKNLFSKQKLGRKDICSDLLARLLEETNLCKNCD